MSFTGVDNLDRSIDKANVWLADIDAGFGTSDRHLAYRILGHPGQRRRPVTAGRHVGVAGPQADDLHAVQGEGPGLVGADHVRGTKRFHRAEPLDHRSAAHHLPHADRQRKGDHRQQALGDVARDQPDANTMACWNDRPAPSVATGRNATAMATAIAAISQATRRI